MPKFKFNKLVRDKVIDHQLTGGAKTSYKVLNDREHKKALINKIIEEAREILSSEEKDIAAEIADVIQAIEDLKAKYGLNDADILKEQRLKKARNGGFKKGIFIDYVELDEGNEWTKYYRKNKDRYPEII